MRAMIFAAGFGSRLAPLTQSLPKALVPIDGKPILEHLIDRLIPFGLCHLTLNTHYLSGQIDRFFTEKNYPFPVRLCHEKKILGTGKGLFNIGKPDGEDPLLILNVDVLSNFSIPDFLDHHLRNRALVTLVTKKPQEDSRLLLDGENRLMGFQKNHCRELLQNPRGKIQEKDFCGIHAISPRIFDLMNALLEVPFSIIDFYKILLCAGEEIATYDIGKAYWIDIGTPENLYQANQDFVSGLV